jgi:hypothetical protein
LCRNLWLWLVAALDANESCLLPPVKCFEERATKLSFSTWDHKSIQKVSFSMVEPEIISPEQLWALVGDEDVAEFRGPDHEITDFDHKQARDMAEFAAALDGHHFDNVVVCHSGDTSADLDDDDFFDRVAITAS